MENVLDKMTDEQRKILKLFKESLDVELNPSYTDELLVKFLRARNFNLKAAKKNFMVNYYNRLYFGVNTLLDNYVKPEVINRYEASSVLGFAKDGTVLRYISAGHLDFYGFIMSVSSAEICWYCSYLMDLDRHTMKQQNLKTGKHVSEITFIVDLEGLTLQQVMHKNVIESGLDLTRLLQDCYPEIWRNVLIVNAPKFFDTVFGVFKFVMRSTAVEKIQLVDKDSTKDLLLKYVDEDVLPAFLGGIRVDSKGDPKCKEFIAFGGKVPEKFYSKNCRILLSPDDPEVRSINIGPRSMFNLSFVAKEAGTTCKIQTLTENGSISVTVLYKEFDPDPENTEMPGEFENLEENSEDLKQISIDMKFQTHCTQEEIIFDVPWPGLYIIRYKNSSNWFASRKLHVKCILTHPAPRTCTDKNSDIIY